MHGLEATFSTLRGASRRWRNQRRNDLSSTLGASAAPIIAWLAGCSRTREVRPEAARCASRAPARNRRMLDLYEETLR